MPLLNVFLVESLPNLVLLPLDIRYCIITKERKCLYIRHYIYIWVTFYLQIYNYAGGSYDRYLYLGGNCIITFRSDGMIGIKPIWILSVTRKKLTIIYDGEKYTFVNLKVVKNDF